MRTPIVQERTEKCYIGVFSESIKHYIIASNFQKFWQENSETQKSADNHERHAQ